MSLTPKATGGRGPEFPYAVAYSALIEHGFTSSPALGTDAHISLWYKDKTAHTAHHHVDILKAGTTVTFAVDGGTYASYTGTIGTYFHELIEGVLTEYAGSAVGYYSDLRAIDGADSTRFWTPSAWTPGTIIPRNPGGVEYGTNGAWLDFGDALDLGADVSGNGNDWVVDSTITWSARATGTAYGSPYAAGYPPSNAFDGNASTFFAVSSNTNTHDFVAVKPTTDIRADKVSIKALFNSSYWLQDYTIYGSLDSTDGVNGTWVELGDFASPYPSSPTLIEQTLSGAVRGMMYKLETTRVTTHFTGLYEVEFREAVQSEQSSDTPTNNAT
jgi:hypothetical protein